MAVKKKYPNKDNIKTELYTTTLKTPLTAAEVAERADRAAVLIESRDQKEEELKAHSKNAKSIIEQIDAEMRQLQSEVRGRSAYKPVDCERQYDFDAGKMREIRLDTYETLNERKLLESERQMELPFGDDKETAK